MPVHVSLHDVTPAWSSEVETALRLCTAVGVRPALLVVPDFHARSPLLGDPKFCGRLRKLQAQGHEVYLHGYFHSSRARPDPHERMGRRLRWLFAQRVVSGGEAEMSDVTAAEGRKRIDEGEGVLRAAGLRIDGFIAPAWSMPDWVMPMLAERGCRFTEDHVRVYDPAGRRARASVVLNWASRSRMRIASTVAWCRVAKYARAIVTARIAIHPADMRVPLLRREIEALLDWARGDFVARGADLLD